MAEGVLGTRVVTQIGILVRDIEKAAQAWADFLGIGKPPIIVTDTVDIAKTEYRGASTPARAKLAFLDAGQVQIELIEPDEAPSVWREHLERYGEGPHHIAFVIDGMKEKVMKLEGLGMPLIQKGEYTGGRYAYMDTFPQLKVMVELLENDRK
ncbi:MAG: lactoylglutathione lyase [Thermobacillus sp. ZCTH02-B1]|uniref:VOC family protein n=1 Tax=Thermobacillus sp. ZCTH02-B1 TaxID=1858795 RepID=UPI000B555A29|nr:VOC family protein [Thermobacillus sp. ZCTH02-B1]OUM95499.1 MAG: lactoylglutathione lyase [Thermobacillus sp. ZCTH02-B1]